MVGVSRGSNGGGNGFTCRNCDGTILHHAELGMNSLYKVTLQIPITTNAIVESDQHSPKRTLNPIYARN